MFLDILSGEVAAPDDVKFKFAFLGTASTAFPWIKFKDLVFSDLDPLSAAEGLISKAGRDLTPEERKKISRHVGITFKAFHSDDGIAYQELDSTENQTLYTEDDVVEMFIRANSGGTKLGKSDLLFSLLTSAWDDADDEMEILLDELNRHGFGFTRDFMLKTCLTLLDRGARYDVDKFRKPGVREEIESEWDAIAEATMEVLDFVRALEDRLDHSLCNVGEV